MVVFVIFTSKTCGVCNRFKEKNKTTGKSMIDLIQTWMSPYYTSTVSIDLEHNGDQQTLTSSHPSLTSIVKGLPAFLLVEDASWQNKSPLTLGNNVSIHSGVRNQDGFTSWGKSFLGTTSPYAGGGGRGRKDDTALHNSLFSAFTSQEQNATEKSEEKGRIPTAGSISFYSANMYA